MSISAPIEQKPHTWASNFHRTQYALGLWGLLLVTGGTLHQLFSADLGNSGQLLMWLSIALIGLVGSVAISREMISSANVFAWATLIVLGFGVTLLLQNVFNLRGAPISAGWHVALALGYIITGYFMDKRLWALAAWEVLMAVVALIINATGSTTGGTPLVDNEPYEYYPTFLEVGMLQTFTTLQAAVNTGLQLSKMQPLLFGLTSGIPLLIAALPFWKPQVMR